MGALLAAGMIALIVGAGGVGYGIYEDYIPVNVAGMSNLEAVRPAGNVSIISEDEVYTRFPSLDGKLNDIPPDHLVDILDWIDREMNKEE